MLRLPKVHRLLAILSIASIAACGGASEPVPAPEGTNPETTGPEITNPETGTKVRVKIAAASLGGGSFGGGSANVQLAFFAAEATAPAAVVVTKVILIDKSSGQTVDTLQASSPSIWNGSSYETWNEKVTPGGDLRASYALTAPDWSAIDSAGKRSSGASSYSISFKLRVTLSIDGAEVTIESESLQREPEVAT